MRSPTVRTAAIALIGLTCAACGSSTSHHTARTSTAPASAHSTTTGTPSTASGTAPSSSASGRATAATAIAALRSVPDTAAYRAQVVVGDLGAMWRAGGIPPRPTVSQASGRAGVQATVQELGGAVGGAGLREVAAQDPDPLGYPAFGIDAELAVGTPPGVLGEVWGPIGQSAVLTAMKPLKLSPPTTVGSSTVVDLGAEVNLQRPAPLSTVLLGTRYLIVPQAGGRLVSAGTTASRSDALGLAAGAAVSHSLAADPAVSPLLQAFGSRVQSLALGTGLITPIAGVTRRLSPPAQAKLKAATGVNRLPAGPVMAGFAYTGGTPGAERVTAAALYPTAPDAEAAATTVAHDTASGTSVSEDLPYSRLWHVDSTTESGPLVILTLTTRSAGSVTEAVLKDDFPLFWAP